MEILVTGGAGYIGSHVCVELAEAGHNVIVADNLSNSKVEAIKRVEKITGKCIDFNKMDLLDIESLVELFRTSHIDAVIHLAGLKAVGESTAEPLKYYENNISGTINLLKVMKAFGVHKMVFSSSATVYGNTDKVPINEDQELDAVNPYGATKLYIERILRDQCNADQDWSVISLRYFNPIGAHKSGTIGENPNGIPNNLLPYVTQVACGRLSKLSVFGGDYPTADGTGVRDYIHVVDLAKGHIKALEKLNDFKGNKVYNLGTGNGYSVLEVIQAFSEATGENIPYDIVERRPGDVAASFADPSKAEKELNWKAERRILEACEDAWRWQSTNPNGYE